MLWSLVLIKKCCKIVLTSSLEDPSFGLEGIQYFNNITQVCQSCSKIDRGTHYLQFIMSLIVVACFLFSMGNKPSAYVSWLFSVSRLLLLYIGPDGNTS